MQWLMWQNHNYAVDPASLPEGVEVTHINLNDGSCAGLAFPALNVMSLQYHPEASPGPHDSDSGNQSRLFYFTCSFSFHFLPFYAQHKITSRYIADTSSYCNSEAANAILK
jgi:carbamoyl-phosphate synthase small subunit